MYTPKPIQVFVYTKIEETKEFTLLTINQANDWENCLHEIVYQICLIECGSGQRGGGLSGSKMHDMRPEEVVARDSIVTIFTIGIGVSIDIFFLD